MLLQVPLSSKRGLECSVHVQVGVSYCHSLLTRFYSVIVARGLLVFLQSKQVKLDFVGRDQRMTRNGQEEMSLHPAVMLTVAFGYFEAPTLTAERRTRLENVRRADLSFSLEAACIAQVYY